MSLAEEFDIEKSACMYEGNPLREKIIAAWVNRKIYTMQEFAAWRVSYFKRKAHGEMHQRFGQCFINEMTEGFPCPELFYLEDSVKAEQFILVNFVRS